MRRAFRSINSIQIGRLITPLFRKISLNNDRRLFTKPRIMEKPVPPIEPSLFASESTRKLNILQAAFDQMRLSEERINTVEQYTDNDTGYKIVYVSIDEIGNYVFKADSEFNMILVSSPTSGVSKYYFDQVEERWVCNKDGHLLDELLMRDLLRNCKGYLKL